MSDVEEDDVGGISSASLEIAVSDVTFSRHIPMMGSIAERRRSSRLMDGRRRASGRRRRRDGSFCGVAAVSLPT